MSDNGHGKLTEAQREQLIRVYLSGGIRAAGPLAVSMGVGRKYPGNIANTTGRHRQPKLRGRSENDPRWAWAIVRGAIIA